MTSLLEGNLSEEGGEVALDEVLRGQCGEVSMGGGGDGALKKRCGDTADISGCDGVETRSIFASQEGLYLEDIGGGSYLGVGDLGHAQGLSDEEVTQGRAVGGEGGSGDGEESGVRVVVGVALGADDGSAGAGYIATDDLGKHLSSKGIGGVSLETKSHVCEAIFTRLGNADFTTSVLRSRGGQLGTHIHRRETLGKGFSQSTMGDTRGGQGHVGANQDLLGKVLKGVGADSVNMVAETLQRITQRVGTVGSGMDGLNLARVALTLFTDELLVHVLDGVDLVFVEAAVGENITDGTHSMRKVVSKSGGGDSESFTTSSEVDCAGKGMVFTDHAELRAVGSGLLSNGSVEAVDTVV